MCAVYLHYRDTAAAFASAATAAFPVHRQCEKGKCCVIYYQHFIKAKQQQ